DDFSSKNTRVIFTMGKGGVGKTSVAAAIAVGLTEKGHKVHLTTTDPAAHLDYMFQNGNVNENLSISSINPEEEVDAYKKEETEKVHKVHLTTTDPAAHLEYMFQNGTVNENLSISSINPEVEVEAYKKEVITNAGELNDDELAYLQEDLESPCTEEIAVFRAF